MRVKLIFYLVSFSSIAFFACQSMPENKKETEATLPFNEPPKWTREAIWYQIFVERFRNGDPANDPTLQTMEGALFDNMPQDWAITPWSHNWYAQENWAKKTGLDFYRTIQMRRYGGDLKGILDKLDYLEDLGVNAIYLNPINDAPSLHKYDARNYHHIDITFGPDPKGDLEKMATEDPGDPATWVWTAADELFIKLVKEIHRRGMRVILDFSWNHTGTQFWAFKDLVKNQDKSKYKNWYEIQTFDDPATSENEFDYHGWVGIKSLPEIKKTDVVDRRPGHAYEGNIHDDPKAHIFAVSHRWMDPDGDGNFDDGVDGFRLDVAEHIGLGFWRDYRKFVRSVNPEFFLVGENWWQTWPDTLMDKRPWLVGDVFDAVMHYHWYKPARGYFNQTDDKLNKEEFQDFMKHIFGMHPFYTQQALMNLAASHDSPRLATSFFNKGKYKFHSKPQENPDYRTDSPDEATWQRIRLFLLHQFTFIGSPHIWNGDEMGMWGADDPDNRKPLMWSDIDFETETKSDFSKMDYAVKPAFNRGIFDYYKSLVSLRKNNPALIHGNFEFVESGNANVLIYKRVWEEKPAIFVVLNNSAEGQILDKSKLGSIGKVLFGNISDDGENLILGAFEGLVFSTE